MFEAIVFDLDGTLIDSRAAILESFAHALAAHDMSPRIALSEVRIGPPLREILRELSGTTDERLLHDLVDSFKHHYDNGAYRATQSFGGVSELLEHLKEKRIPCFVATNKRFAATRLILKHLEFEEFFDAVYALDRKDPPLANKTAMLANLLEDQSLFAVNTLYVGDTPEDEAAARANNMHFAAVAWGYGDFEGSKTSTFAAPCELQDYLIK